MSNDQIPFDLLPALLQWALITGITVVLGLAITTAIAVVVLGAKGFSSVGSGLVDSVRDLFGTSSRRVWALALLTGKEAVRRKTLMVLAVFGVLFLFAGWYLPRPGADPDQQIEAYVSFVLTATSWLCLPIIFLLACWGLPADIKARSLHTVVTKPVRRNEILLGRILGITLVGTAVLLIMGTFGYFWLDRALFTPLTERRLVEKNLSEKEREAEHNKLKSARVPVYAKSKDGLTFIDREGKPGVGVNVGDIWEFRSYIEGNTKARAIWEFEGVTDKRFGNSLRIESRIQVFRSHKGDMEAGILCQYTFVNDKTQLRVPYPAFPIKEFRDDVRVIDRKLINDQNQPVDLFNDLAPDGKLKIEVACLNGGQYLGMARPDLFIRSRDASFASSYFKALFGIWLIMLVVTVMGTVASCFLKGPVATVLVLLMLVMGGPARKVLERVTDWDKAAGGGPAESIYRILQHLTPESALPENVYVQIVRVIDIPPRAMLWATRHIVPNFESCTLTEYTAKGYDVPWDAALAPALAMALGFILPCIVLGYFSLKYRELESK